MANRNVLLAYDVEDVGGIDRILGQWGYAWLSPKLDGYRAITTSGLGTIVSSQGNPFNPPDSWLSQLREFQQKVAKTVTGPFRLDGELWCGHGTLQKTGSIVKKKHAHAGWNDVLFCVFDIVAYGVYPVDVNAAWEMIGYDGGNIVGVQHTKVTTRGDIERAFHDVVSRGGEGVMLRHPRCVWMPRRSRDLVKVKPERDAEGVIIGYVPGAGRLTGMLGSLQLRLPSGQTFGLAGLSDAERSVGWECRFPIGATVTFKYSGLTADGIPREARFWRLRND